MNRRLSMLAAVLVAALPTAGGARAGTQRAGTTITVWDDLTVTTAHNGLAALAAKWGAAHGFTVNFVTANVPGGNGIAWLLPQKAKSPGGPDLVYIPEDEQGGLAADKLIAPRPAGVLSMSDLAKYRPYALGAAVVDGVAYSIPHDEDSLMLLYNKRLVKTPPTTWAELVATAKRLTRGTQYGFLYYIDGGLYWNFWAFSGYGAYVFGNKGGHANTTDIGLDNAAAAQALTFIQSLAALMPKNTDYSSATIAFQAGKAAMTIDGQWDFAFYAKSLGKDLGAASIPSFPGGRVSRPFVGIRVWAVNHYSKNQQASWELARYLSLNGQAITALFQDRLPTLMTVPGFTPTALQTASEQQFSTGVLMPNTAAMAEVWTPEFDAIDQVLKGKASPRIALKTAVQRIRAGIAKLGGQR